ncbi:MAG: OmpA family protein [Acidobacteria bacterium]|nr:OmpA family protein [Acidobacteriota bacterium]
MKRVGLILMLSTMLLPFAAMAQDDVEGGKDHPLFTRMPGFYIQRYEEKDFDTHSFWEKGKEVPVEGRTTTLLYAVREGVKEPSRLQVLANHENAARKAGGTVLSRDDDGNAYLRLAEGGREYWVHVNAYITSQYTVVVVEKKAMTQDVAANAEAWSRDIGATGRAAVYGIFFDSGKSEFGPGSDAALAEIARLLKANPGWSVWVVGHTDSTGDAAVNLALSKARSEAVVRALVGQHGIELRRLEGHGVGPLAPVASNDTDEGKAKNRRVEIVKR